WKDVAQTLGVAVEFVPGDWRHGAGPDNVERILREEGAHEIKGGGVVHNETSAGVARRIPEMRQAMDGAPHPARLMGDSTSRLGSMEYRHDEWGIDVTVGGSQKGLMLPPGLSFNAISEKALAASRTARLTRSYWDWQAMLNANRNGFFPYTPATNLLY